jgi:hypothetical protein
LFGVIVVGDFSRPVAPDQVDGPGDGPGGQQPPQVVAAGQIQRPLRVAEALVDAVERAQGHILIVAA